MGEPREHATSEGWRVRRDMEGNGGRGEWQGRNLHGKGNKELQRHSGLLVDYVHDASGDPFCYLHSLVINDCTQSFAFTAFCEMWNGGISCMSGAMWEPLLGCAAAGMQVMAEKTQKTRSPPTSQTYRDIEGGSFVSPRGPDSELCSCNNKEQSDLGSAEDVLTSKQMKLRLQEKWKRTCFP